MCDDCCVAGFFSLEEALETLVLLEFAPLEGYGFDCGRVGRDEEVESLLWEGLLVFEGKKLLWRGHTS